jgi:hypothetical protein
MSTTPKPPTDAATVTSTTTPARRQPSPARPRFLRGWSGFLIFHAQTVCAARPWPPPGASTFRSRSPCLAVSGCPV